MTEQIEQVEAKPLPKARAGTVPYKAVHVMQGEVKLRFVIRPLSGPQEIEQLEYVIGIDRNELQKQADDPNYIPKMDREQAKLINEMNIHILLDNIIECPDGNPPDMDYVRFIDKDVQSALLKHIRPDTGAIQKK